MEVDKVNDSENKDDEILLPGFRFHPTDEELVGFYLRRKVENKPICIEIIKQVDIYKYDPWDLPKTTLGEKEWYFFCIRGRKYRNSIRPNRVTGSGFWKATGIDKPIYSLGDTNNCIGLKKSLVYYKGSAGKGTKTDWMMHEFRLPPVVSISNHLNAKNPNQEAEILTLCRIFKRIVSYRKYAQDLKEISSKKGLNDSSSRTCSFESENKNEYKRFGASIAPRNEKKTIINHIAGERTQSTSSQLSSITQAPLMASYNLSFPNPNGNFFFRDGNWDELGSVVELATDPTFTHGFR